MTTTMRKFGILISFLLMAAFAKGQGCEDYMSEVWLSAPQASFLIPYSLEPEPLNRLGAIHVPGTLGQTYLVPVDMGDGKWRVQGAKNGLGGFLEAKTEGLGTYPKDFAGGQIASHYRLEYSVFSVKGKSNNRRLVMTNTLLQPQEFPWSDPLFDDFAPAFCGPDSLLFASNRPGGSGGMDIWLSTRINGTWGMPSNLGPAINSPADEINPSAHPSGHIAFASNRPSGLGGFDLYLHSGDLQRLPYPINTRFDELGIAFNNEDLWVSSTRPRETLREAGPSQLYRLRPKQVFSSRVMQARTGIYLPKVPVKVTDGYHSGFVDSDDAGWVKFYLTPGRKYDLRVAIEGYDPAYFLGVNLDKPLPLINITEKNYCMTTVNVMENGKASKRQAWVSIYKNGVLLDSMQTNATGTLIRDLEPKNAYLQRVYLPGYPSQEHTFTAGASGKMNYARTFYFGLAEGAFLSVTARDPNGNKVSGVKVQFYQDGLPYLSLTPPFTGPNGNTGALLPEKSHLTLLGLREDMFGYCFHTTEEVDRRIDTTEISMSMAALNPGEVLISFQVEIDPIQLQAGKAAEMRIARDLLEHYPGLVLELGVHTDSRGAAADNLRRSKQAAEFAVDYFQLKGIEKGRVVAKGYGESKLVNTCGDGVNCSEDQHSVNNRIEFKVVRR